MGVFVTRVHRRDIGQQHLRPDASESQKASAANDGNWPLGLFPLYHYASNSKFSGLKLLSDREGLRGQFFRWCLWLFPLYHCVQM